eukprot:CAMPEP_0113291852 /NCGR_PEP_ID=MMETSP0008_2-20120614/34296_1 /TAXON_ID=97485 /ORGANISM="Prymnesium parvum" /LENGTH=1239 /DNA_ID=CAMNT_0000143845 /DNA_START=65 /DNA_END=3784 /DNA_ORIENTATION=+ /assembly_acc=CAM_ASM_000153
MAIELGKAVLIVVLPGQRFGPTKEGKRTASFPENAFNPAWTPFVPEVKPAFADIAVTWHNDHETASLSQFLRRLHTMYKHVNNGASLYDVKLVHMELVKQEELELEKVRNSVMPGGPMQWDWKEKVFDQFLSHKITDAKDIVLTWYNAMSACGFNPFLDRMSLDRVENIPLYVKQTCSFIIAVTSHLYESYWCMVELMNAVDLHAEKQIQILLVPIEGEQWPASLTDSEAGVVDWPPIPEVCKNLDKWFPEVLEQQRDDKGIAIPDTTLFRIEQLYAYGSFTQERLVHHTLIHYKSFERLLLARCGVSIATKKILDEICANGGTALADKAAALYGLVAEANALHKQLGSQMSFVVVHDFHKAELSINEVFNEKVTTTLTPQQFISKAMVLRSETDHLRAATTAISANLLEQWQLIAMHSPDATYELDIASEENMGYLVGVFGAAQQVFKILISFFQINTAFLQVFPTVSVAWPASFTEMMSPILMVLEPVGAFFDTFSSLLITFEYVQVTFVFVLGSLALIVWFVLIYLFFTKLLCRTTMTERHKAQFLDYTIFSCVLMIFLLYPSLSVRTLRLYQYNTYGSHTLLAADLRLRYEDLITYGSHTLLAADLRLRYEDLFISRMVGLIFIFGFILGVPVLAYIALFNVAGPGRRNVDAMYHKLDERRAEMDRRYARRMGILFTKYVPSCWWWEVFDLTRKLFLTSVIVFIETGSVLQVWVGIFISLFALLMTVQFRPFVNWKLDLLNFSSQFCTLLTLIGALGFHKDSSEGGLTQLRFLMPSGLIALQLAPSAIGVVVVTSFVYEIYDKRRQKKKKLEDAPAALKDEPPKSSRYSSAWFHDSERELKMPHFMRSPHFSRRKGMRSSSTLSKLHFNSRNRGSTRSSDEQNHPVTSSRMSQLLRFTGRASSSDTIRRSSAEDSDEPEPAKPPVRFSTMMRAAMEEHKAQLARLQEELDEESEKASGAAPSAACSPSCCVASAPTLDEGSEASDLSFSARAAQHVANAKDDITREASDTAARAVPSAITTCKGVSNEMEVPVPLASDGLQGSDGSQLYASDKGPDVRCKEITGRESSTDSVSLAASTSSGTRHSDESSSSQPSCHNEDNNTSSDPAEVEADPVLSSRAASLEISSTRLPPVTLNAARRAAAKKVARDQRLSSATAACGCGSYPSLERESTPGDVVLEGSTAFASAEHRSLARSSDTGLSMSVPSAGRVNMRRAQGLPMLQHANPTQTRQNKNQK